jgi:glycosyltransferase involved in cell wall biosynthesis
VAGAAASRNIEVVVVQAAAEDDVIEAKGIVCHFVSARSPSRLQRRMGHWASPLASRLGDRLASLQPDLVHLHSLAFPLHARLITMSLPATPLLVQDHADRAPRWWERPIYRTGFKGVTGVAFTAREQAVPFTAVLPADTRVFEVLESSTYFTAGDQEAAQAETGVFGDPCLLWLGRLDANKDPLTVLDAVNAVVPVLPDPHLWCFFQAAPLLDAVQQRVGQDSNMAGRVHLMGERPHAEIERLLRAADFLVQGSHSESCGFAVIEALACGTVPIVTDIPPLRRITGGGAVGALFPPGDAGAMARMLVDWAGRDRIATRYAARDHFERALSIEALGEELRAAYQALLEEG